MRAVGLHPLLLEASASDSSSYATAARHSFHRLKCLSSTEALRTVLSRVLLSITNASQNLSASLTIC